MANELLLASPVTSYLQGRQATQQNQLAQQQLQSGQFQMQQAQQQASREDQFRNALASYLQGGSNSLAQLYMADPEKAMQVQAWQRQQQVEQAKQVYAAASAVLTSAAPAKRAKILHPDAVAAWAAQNGKSPDDLTDEQAKEIAGQVRDQAAAAAGILPEKPIEVPEGGTLIDPATRQPIFNSPAKDSSITPYQQAQLGIERAKLGLEQQKAAATNNPLGLGAPNAITGTGPTGDDFLKTLPKNVATQVKALSEGRMAFPAGFALKSPYWQQMIAAVSQYDPNFDSVNYNARSKTRNDFTSGKNAQNIKSLNTAIGHLGALNDQIEGTASHGLTALNYLQNRGAELTGSSGPTKFKQTAGALASELTQVFRGSGGAEADVKRYLEELNVNASAEQKKAAVTNIVELLNSRLNAIGDQYNQGMGTTKDPLTLLNPKAQKVFSRIAGGSAPKEAPAVQAPTVNAKGWVLHTDKNGNRAYVSPDGKSFEEVK